MDQNISIRELTHGELLAINGGNDCPLDTNSTAHQLGWAIGRVIGFAAGATLVSIKLVLEKVL